MVRYLSGLSWQKPRSRLAPCVRWQPMQPTIERSFSLAPARGRRPRRSARGHREQRGFVELPPEDHPNEYNSVNDFLRGLPVTRRQFFAANAAIPALQAQTAPRPAAPTGPKPPNILFILVDQMTPFMTGPYGSRIAKTPNLDRLARDGVVFENAYCNSPLCVPSRASMWSGRMPSNVQSYDNGSEFPAHLPTIPYLMRTAGYRTAVAGKCHFIGADQLHGFDERLTPCIFPAGFDMTPNWRLGAIYNRGTSMQQMLRMLGPSKWNRQLAFDSLCCDESLLP